MKVDVFYVFKNNSMKTQLFFTLLSLLVSSSASAQWANTGYNYPMAIYGIHFINEQTGYVAGYHELYKTGDGGASWSLLCSNVFTNGPSGVWFLNENIGFIIGQDGGATPQVSKTINGGVTWTTTTLPVSGMGFHSANKIFFFDNTLGFIVCQGGLIYRTTDQGTTWTSINSMTSSDLNSVYFPTAMVGYVSSQSDGVILKTLNGGMTWSQLQIGQTVNVNDLYFTSADTGFLACNESKILKTTNGGLSWSVTNFGTNDFFNTIIFTTKNIGYAAGNAGLIAATTDGGVNWSPTNSGITDYISLLSFPSLHTGYAVTILSGSGYSNVLKTISGGGVNAITELRPIIDFKIFPNPAGDHLTILYSTANTSTTNEVRITDLLGQTIDEFTLNANEPFSYSTDNLSSTIYFATLYIDHTVAKQLKFVVRR